MRGTIEEWEDDSGRVAVAMMSGFGLETATEDGSTTAYVANFSIAMGTELGNGPSILVLELGG